ncbi:MAG: GNAT family N-acetyltransferase, partial [Candidatus Bipolaricaulia bacterium]
RMAAWASAVLLKTDENRHLLQFDIEVRAEHRRRGLARRLLRAITDVAHERGRTLLITNTDSKIPAGEAFLERIGAQVALTFSSSQLEIADVDPDQLREWQEQARERAADFEIGLWDGPYPEEELAAIAELNQVMNTAPRGDLDVEDFEWTSEQLRQTEASLEQQGIERWTMYARHRPTGQFAGYTETYWIPEQPELLHQGNTGVFPEYRGHGLGKWLKAAMLEKVLNDKPQVKRVRTGNADVNEAMLAINRKLGFKPYKSLKTWQVEVSTVQAYLDERG